MTASVVEAVASASSLYEVLGVTPDVDDEALRTAYRKRLLHLHPDKCGDDEGARGAFQAVSDAFGVLSDTGKRLIYDEVLGGQGLDTSDMQRAALFHTVAKAMGAALVPSARVCASPGCLRSPVEGAIGPSTYCASCAAERQPKCRSCGVPVEHREAECSACMRKPLAKGGKCSNLGCFNSVAAGSPAGEQCEKCLRKPRKCSSLGCFTMCVPPAERCAKHATTK